MLEVIDLLGECVTDLCAVLRFERDLLPLNLERLHFARALILDLRHAKLCLELLFDSGIYFVLCLLCRSSDGVIGALPCGSELFGNLAGAVSLRDIQRTLGFCRFRVRRERLLIRFRLIVAYFSLRLDADAGLFRCGLPRCFRRASGPDERDTFRHFGG